MGVRGVYIHVGLHTRGFLWVEGWVNVGQLNGLSVPTARGGLWYAGTVRNYHKRLQNTQAA